MKPVSGYHVASEPHFRSPFFPRYAIIIIVLLYQLRVPFSPSPFHKRSITIPFNRNGQEWRAPDDNNINRIPSACKSMGTPRTSFRKEHTFLCCVRILCFGVPSCSPLKGDCLIAFERYSIPVPRYMEKRAYSNKKEEQNGVIKALIEICILYINPLALARQ